MKKTMNLPNILTLIRMILAPIYLALMVADFNHHYLVAAIVFGVASLTDFFDGKIARKYNLITVFGKLCDPVGDKMLFLAAILAFMKTGYCSVWVIMIVISREFLVTSMRMVAIDQNVVIAAGIWGKVKTACQMVFTILVMIMLEFGVPSWCKFSAVQISNVLMWILAVLTLVSGIKYLLDSRKVIDFSK